ncbi:MAG: hypothetical protein JKY55_01055 [Aliivibrio sp.]|uniref:hypothetical protein n=1 Tax=Aliivibrio sp. TaxID=1872443 RepID=UPI001A5DE3C6|nr:hypothetical protein [Aliivibrio sp.]
MKKRKEQQTKNYSIDKTTRRATFLKNNKAALVHGGYSKKIPETLVSSILAGDLGFEIGMLKGQLSNIALLGEQAIDALTQQGESALALEVALSCADSTARLIPQIQKALESHLSVAEELDSSVTKTRTRWLKKLRAGDCDALEVAYQFEINDLGELPNYVHKQVDNALRAIEPELVPELYSREELSLRLQSYWQKTEGEEAAQQQRKLTINAEKQRINEQFFGAPIKQSKESGEYNG